MHLVSITILLFLLSHLSAQETIKQSLFDRLYSADEINVTLTYPFDSLYRMNNEEIDARITLWTGKECLMKEEPISMNLRGKFRRMKCEMPPLMLNFKKSTLKDLGLQTIDEVKLVTYCIEGEEGIENLEEERMIYQLYESLTPVSYRTIWLNINYCNETDSSQCIRSFGFLLEPDKVLSGRLGIDEKKMYNMTEDSIDLESYARTTAFNFMIGNRDWSIIASRNAKLFFNDSTKKYIVIPYDFDYSNIVAASYRRETLPKTMTHPFDRLYQGEYFNDQAGDILKQFHDHKTILLGTLFTADNSMSRERREKIANYLEYWFDLVKTKNAKSLRYGIVLPYNGGL